MKYYSIKSSDIFLIITFNLLIFQNILMSNMNWSSYIDEMLVVFLVLHFFINMLKRKHIQKQQLQIILCLIILLILGLIANMTSDVSRTGVMIILDFFYFAKVFLCIICAIDYFKLHKPSKSTISFLVKELSILIGFAFVCLIFSQFKDIGMTRGERYGFKSFKFLYKSPGMLSMYCMLFLVVLTIGLELKKTRAQYINIALLILVWMSTGRTRAFAILAVWAFLLYISKNKNFDIIRQSDIKSNIRYFFKKRYFIISLPIIFVIGWDQVMHYFGNEADTARSLLLVGGFKVMKKYFPFGSGFGTFGTEVAKNFYSPLYYIYGLNNYWALAEGGTELTDCFWPAVAAQFGLFGLIIMMILVYKFSKVLINYSKGKKYGLIGCITYIIFLLISSTGTSIYTGYVTVGTVFIIIAMLSIFQVKH